MLCVKQIVNTPVSSNCFVVYDLNISNNCLIIDPGTEKCNELLFYLEKEQLIPEYILLTHEHFDHIWGVNYLRNCYSEVKVVCNRMCSEMIIDKKKNCSVYYNQVGFELLPADILIENIENILIWEEEKIKFYHTPGHTSGSISFIIGDNLFTGDTLIQGEKTVTKLPGGARLDLEKTLNLLGKFKGKNLIVRAGHKDSFELDLYNIADAL
ncbi:MAG: MBL fold metallo-hydrolase [Odoribacter sp.]